jgi:predicted adenylyl cyclase CyaB
MGPVIPVRRNLEMKARIASLETARSKAEAVCTAYLGVQQQTDTYFRCPHGRLKLREIEEPNSGRQCQLIWYLRPDQQSFKQSEYHLVSVADATGLKAALAAALGVRHIVSKRREIFLHENVRIHLDQVRGLGEFLELEAVMSATEHERDSPARLAQLVRHFGILPEEWLPASYVDLLSQDG